MADTPPRLEAQLELVIGPMFSGKSTELIRRLRRARHASKKVLLVKWSEDTRYSNTHVITHDQDTKEEAIVLQDLGQLTDDQLRYLDVLCIDEIQFFKKVHLHVRDFINSYPRLLVIVAGLNATSKRTAWGEPFGDIWSLAPIASKIHLKTGVCYWCKYENASCSARIVHAEGVLKVGGAESYKCACESCHRIHNVD